MLILVVLVTGRILKVDTLPILITNMLYFSIIGCYTTTSNDWGIYTLIHLPLSLAMLACSIISASLTCVAREESKRGAVWATQQGN